VKERDHTQFTYSFGYGSEEQAYGELGWRHLNFLGGARTVSARGKWSWLDRGGEGVFVQPYFFRPGLALVASGYVWQFDEAPFDALSGGGRAGLRYTAGRTTFTGTSIYEFQQRLDPRARVPRIPQRGDRRTNRVLDGGPGDGRVRLQRRLFSQCAQPIRREDVEAAEDDLHGPHGLALVDDDAQPRLALAVPAHVHDALRTRVGVSAVGIEGFEAPEVGLEDGGIEVHPVAPGQPRTRPRVEDGAQRRARTPSISSAATSRRALGAAVG